MPAPGTVALLTDRRYTATAAAPGDWYLGNILADDRLLRDALARRGIASERVDWAAPGVDWAAYRAAVFRSTWDYFDRFPEFAAWLRAVEQQVPLVNPAATVWWNLDKHYLADLAARGVPVVPSRFLEKGSATTLAEVLQETGWAEAVVKPCVSGAARHTYRVNPTTAAAVGATIRPLLADEAFLVQPFQHDITARGEVTLMAFDGAVTHAVRKVAKAGDFRVQDDHGGTVHHHAPTPAEVDLAVRAMAACGPPPVYGRVDMVRGNDGRLAVMELELIEPELWLRFHPPAADAFADALAKWLSAA